MESEPVVNSPEFVAVLVKFFTLDRALTTRDLSWDIADCEAFNTCIAVTQKLAHWAKMEERYK